MIMLQETCLINTFRSRFASNPDSKASMSVIVVFNAKIKLIYTFLHSNDNVRSTETLTWSKL